MTEKISCPSCGSMIDRSASVCGTCNTQIKFFAEEGVVLPMQMSAQEIESQIIHKESDFWQATINAINAPYSFFKEFRHYGVQNFKDDLSIPPFKDCLAMFYDSFVILPNENYVTLVSLNSVGSYALLTSLRVVVYRDTQLLSIPLESLVSWKEERSTSGTNVTGRDGIEKVGQPVLRYRLGDIEKSIRFDPSDLWIAENVIDSVKAGREWEDLNPLQKNLLTLSRYKLSKSYKIQLRPLELMVATPPPPVKQKKGCFIATATLGDYNHPVVQDLRKFRDHWILEKTWGATFVTWYYEHGPKLAGYIENSPVRKRIVFLVLIKPLHLLVRRWIKLK